MSANVHLDVSIGKSEEARFMNKHLKLIQQMSKKYNCPFRKVSGLVIQYYKFQLQSNAKGMTKAQFQDFLHYSLDITDQHFIKHIMSAIEVKRSSTVLPIESWVSAMMFFVNGNFKDQLEHCFKVYDAFNTGSINQRTMAYFLKGTFIGQNAEDAKDSLTDFMEVLMRKIDLNGNGEISYEDYKNFVLKHPLAMELLGPCLPSRYAVRGFLDTYYGKEKRH
ncbi:hypothetical protein RI129_001218 [Pyrocoelia pectoralis]|uniref:EF-hand domain-containing protein n=1 Tax=Pyrocoelia pectoralis TaxID=417401 RepID=A0AAN7VUZ7_9COLE